MTLSEAVAWFRGVGSCHQDNCQCRGCPAARRAIRVADEVAHIFDDADDLAPRRSLEELYEQYRSERLEKRRADSSLAPRDATAPARRAQWEKDNPERARDGRAKRYAERKKRYKSDDAYREAQNARRRARYAAAREPV